MRLSGGIGGGARSNTIAVDWVGAVGFLALTAGACGGGGAASERDATPLPLEVPAQALPPAERGVPYQARLAARGGRAPYRFALAPASAPLAPGLSLASDGRIAGTPSGAGSATFALDVEVEDATGEVAEATAAVTLAVDPPFTVAPDIEDGDTVAPGQMVRIAVAGGMAPYQAVLAVDASGGQVVLEGAAAVYVAGGAALGLTDVIDLVDARGRVRSVAFPIDGEPFAGFQPRLGATDAWRIRFDVRRGVHAYGSDLEHELVSLGLRAAGATGVGDLADQLALALVKRRVLGHIAGRFGLRDDGTDQTGSLRISLFAEDTASASAPAEATAISARPGRYNVMEVAAHVQDGVLGRAFLDNAQNGAIEHDGGVTPFGEALGVDVAECVAYFRAFHGSGLASAPIGPADAPALGALLRGGAPTTPRAQQIVDVIDLLAFRMGFVIAHEIGHSAGLAHNGVSGSLMFPNLSFAHGVDPRFTGPEWTQLDAALPGPNRGGVASPIVVGGGPGAGDELLDRPVVELRWDAASGRTACSACDATSR